MVPRLSCVLGVPGVLLLSLALAACESPAEPSGGTSMAISSVAPSLPVQSDAPQLLFISGGNFLTPPILFVTDPDGLEVEVSGSAIRNRQLSSFEAFVLLDEPGRYELRVGPSSGARSPPFSLTVRGSESSPVIFNATPGTLSASTTPAIVTLNGLDFDANLVLTIADPDGAVVALGASQLLTVGPTAVQLSHAFTKVGLYTFRVTNPSGDVSNPVSISVV